MPKIALLTFIKGLQVGFLGYNFNTHSATIWDSGNSSIINIISILYFNIRFPNIMISQFKINLKIFKSDLVRWWEKDLIFQKLFSQFYQIYNVKATDRTIKKRFNNK
jgi:hypothetical protein